MVYKSSDLRTFFHPIVYIFHMTYVCLLLELCVNVSVGTAVDLHLILLQ
jgi:hypothetical protein